MLRIDERQLRDMSVHLNTHSTEVVVQAHSLVNHYGQLLEAQVKANADTGHHAPGAPHIPGTGPGPNVATGDYLRTIGGEPFTEGAIFGFAVGTDDRRAARLEWGFIGVDSAGRTVHAPAYPHFGPAGDVIGARFETALLALPDPV